ncbi:fluoride efflux transporter FluC [Streptomyces sp. NPDC058439]|uniref:fluoride efflux transporter FluC n=1 Tax=Streptomyces sp. NPDC058439 TaxID=3346500 RepID=UPI00366A49FD
MPAGPARRCRYVDHQRAAGDAPAERPVVAEQGLRFPGAPRLISPLLGTGLLGGFLSEAVTGGDIGPRLQLLLATGFCGALSTWSTFSYELLTLTSARSLATAAGYLLLGVGAEVGLSFAGAAVAKAVF